MTPTEPREVVKFPTNVPVEIALKFAGQGKIISTRFGERVLCTLHDDRVMFLDLGVAQKLTELGVNVRETFFVCKTSGARKGAEWRVWLTPETENARAAAKAGHLPTLEEQTPLHRPLPETIELVKQGKLRGVGDGTFVVKAGVSIPAPISVPIDACNADGTAHNGNANALRSHGNGNGGANQHFSTTTERITTMETNRHAVAGALTPATAEVVTNDHDHSNTDENTRNQGSARTELTVVAQEISRFIAGYGHRASPAVTAGHRRCHPEADAARRGLRQSARNRPRRAAPARRG